MCDPMTAAALAASAGGAVIAGNERADSLNAQVNARNAATQAELARSKVYGQESRGIFDKSVGNFTPEAQGAALSTGQQDAGKAFSANLPTNVGHITTANAPRVVGEAENTKVADTFTRLGSSAEKHGNLAGYDQQMFGNKVALADSGRHIDTIGDFAKTSAGVNQVEQRAAFNNATKPSSGIGELLQLGGQLGAYYGGRGGGLPTNSLFGSPSAFVGSATGPLGNTLPFGGPR